MEVAVKKQTSYLIATFIRFFLASVFLLGLSLLYVQSLNARTLKLIDASSHKNDNPRLVLSFDKAPPKLKSYTLKNPERIVIDLPETKSQVKRYRSINKNNIKNLNVIQAGSRTRLVMELAQPAVLKSDIQGNKLNLTIVETEQDKNRAEKTIQRQELVAVDFKRGNDGAGSVIFKTSVDDVPVTVEDNGQQLSLIFPGLELPDFLNKRLDVTEFSTPVEFVTIEKTKGQTKVNIDLKGKFEYLSWQSGKKFILSVHEIEKNKKPGSGKLTHTGQKLSLNFQNIEVRAILQLLADEQNFNLVASDAVKGNVTLRLEDVPWDQALNIILRSKGLDKRLEGNILIVAPAQELANRERQSLESNKQIKDLSPLYTELMQINYAKASDITTVLKGSEKNRILSERGSVQVVERTNSLLVNETREKLTEIRNLVEKIDIPVRQVMIEARIVEARTNLREELGVSWGNSTAAELNTVLPEAGGRTINNINANLGGSKVLKDLFVSLPVAGATSGIRLGYVTNSVDLSIQLSALETDSKVEIISQPQIITANKKKAVIKKGEERAFETTSDSGTNTTFRDVSLALEVTPQITPDGRVIMDVDVTNNEVTGTDAKGNPITSINEINTQLLVNDGQTVVLGGIFKNSVIKSEETVPLLGKLPILGNLFRRDIDRNEKSELLIFITPRVITEYLAENK